MPGEPWRVTVTGGSVVLSEGADDPHPVVLNKVLLRANLDLARKRIELVQGDIAGAGIAGFLNGSVDFSGEPRLAAGLAITPMSAQMAKKVWPVFVATKVRNWVVENLQSGDIERIDIATNSPIEKLKEDGPPIPQDGLSVDVTVRNATIRPVDRHAADHRGRSQDQHQGPARRGARSVAALSISAAAASSPSATDASRSPTPIRNRRRRARNSGSTDRCRRRSNCWPANGFAVRPRSRWNPATAAAI